MSSVSARPGTIRNFVGSSVVARYLLAAALVAVGLLLSLFSFERQNVRVLSRLMETEATAGMIGGLVRPASESVVSVERPVAVSEVLVEPGQAVRRGDAMFVVEDHDARLALPAARLEADDALLQLRTLELGFGAQDRELRDLSSRYTLISAELDVAARRVTTIPLPQTRESAARAQAAADLASLDLERARQLSARGVVPLHEVDEREIAMRVARDDLELAQRAETAHRMSEDAESARAQLRLQLASAEDQRERLRRVAERGRAAIRYQRAVTAVRELEARVAASRIVAPADGTISEVRVSRGDVATAGAVLARMADVSRLVVEVSVPSEHVPRLRTGGRAEVRMPVLPEARTSGIIRSIEPTPGPTGRHLVVVGFAAPGGGILTGQAATVSFQAAP
jgi:multidrug resistance efflux pump